MFVSVKRYFPNMVTYEYDMSSPMQGGVVSGIEYDKINFCKIQYPSYKRTNNAFERNI